MIHWHWMARRLVTAFCAAVILLGAFAAASSMAHAFAPPEDSAAPAQEHNSSVSVGRQQAERRGEPVADCTLDAPAAACVASAAGLAPLPTRIADRRPPAAAHEPDTPSLRTAAPRGPPARLPGFRREA